MFDIRSAGREANPHDAERHFQHIRPVVVLAVQKVPKLLCTSRFAPREFLFNRKAPPLAKRSVSRRGRKGDG